MLPAALVLALARSAPAAEEPASRPYDGVREVATRPDAAAPAPVEPSPPVREPEPVAAPPVTSERDTELRRIRVPRRRPELSNPDRSGSIVTRRELDERLPRSAPDALRNEPGVYVQQTAHAQASPYIRGLTGQQTVMMFDGVRLNNSTFRQGPNQYFFTVDSRSIHQIEVIRGSASTRYGADAMGGVIMASPIESTLDTGSKKVVAHGRGIFQTTTADSGLGGRAQLDLGAMKKFGVFGGVGYRDLNLLRSGGPVESPATKDPYLASPRFASDGKTQLGTGFRELTGDVRAVVEPAAGHRLTIAYYDYRQKDAPRTDQCPPKEAPENECLTYRKQNRSLVYGKYVADQGPAGAEVVTWTVSYQRQHENRYLRRGATSSTRRSGRDTVHSVGTALALQTKRFQLGKWANLGVDYGLDIYHDRVRSRAELIFVDTNTIVPDGAQYTDGARYMTGGVWATATSQLTRYLRLRAGGRGTFAWAASPQDKDRDTPGLNRYWFSIVGSGGIAVLPTQWLSLLVGVDEGFRAPNLDDLISRQLIGPGYQFENPNLKFERATMIETGFKINHPWIELEAYFFQTYLKDFIQRAARERAECPEGDMLCDSGRFVQQLVNTDGIALLRGAEGGIRLYLPYDLGVAATISYVRGDSPNPNYGVTLLAERNAPISRVPPLHGGAEIGWRSSEWGVYLVAAMRWARKQTRLADQDLRDVRIPLGGTPGYVVFDLRAGYRLDPWVLLGLVFENVADTAYRVHGSAINGAGRGLLFEMQFGF
ncbi:MAG TPA: TonB-dependent receptor [Nannocystaceae bacterium]|nr:TonB-dependent receptor [Nannocystaceae bacterium]